MCVCARAWLGRWVGGWEEGEGGQASANWDRRSGSGRKKEKRSTGETGSPQALGWLTLLNDASLS